MDFSKALIELKKGEKLAREGWNGKGLYVTLVPGLKDIKPSVRMQEAHDIKRDELITIEPYFQIKNAQGTFNTWVPSVSDLLANDWEVLTRSTPRHLCEDAPQAKGSLDDNTYKKAECEGKGHIKVISKEFDSFEDMLEFIDNILKD